MTNPASPLAADDIATQNQQAIDLLVRMITRSLGEFSPVLVVCNYADLRKQMVDRLRQQCPVEIQGISLPKKADRLLPAIEARVQRQLPPALMVFGMEKVANLEQVLHRANRIREEFRNHFPLPLIFWVDDPTLAMVTRHAPDFYSWMPVAVRFDLPTDALVDLLQQRITTEFNKFLAPATLIENLRFDADRHHQPYAELEAAVRDLEKRGYQLTPELIAGVQFVQGREALAHNNLGSARDLFDRSLAFYGGFYTLTEAEEHTPDPATLPAPDLAYQACIHFHLGLTWRVRATANRAEYLPYCAKARDHFQQCLDYFRQLGRLDLVAQYLTPLGEVLHRLEEWDALEQLANEGLRLHRQFDDPVRLANDYGLLAIVAGARDRWQDAQRLAIAALDTLHKAEQEGISDVDLIWAKTYHLNWYRFTLAQAMHHLGNIDGAIATLEQARQESDTKYDPALAIRLREDLRNLYYRRGQYAIAFDLKQEQRSLEQQYGFRAFLGAGMLKPQRQPVNPLQAEDDDRPAIAREIATSGRTQDVNALIRRLRDPQVKLVVIHGPSGVGKSSILSAALIPALHHTRLEERNVLPILLRRYGRWQPDLTAQILASTKAGNNSSSPLSSDPLPLIQSLASSDYYLILIFDQFEEFFFNPDHSQPEQRLPFYHFLRDCLNTPFVKVVLAIREDYIHYLLEFDRLTALEMINDDILSKDIRYYLGDFTPDQARQEIRSATHTTPYQPEPALIEQLVTDLAGQLRAVRPIELQIIGAELQDSNITTLAEYQRLGDHPKETLVTRSLRRVIEDCGHSSEQQDLAQLVLYLLTDDKDHRLQKTASELAQELQQDFGIQLSPLTSDAKALHHIEESPYPLPLYPSSLTFTLAVLQGSGIVLQIPAEPEPRYQIVHDYLVSHIRQQYRNRLEAKYAALEAKYEQTLADKLAMEEQLNQTLKDKLRQTRRTVVALSILGGLFALAALTALAAIGFGIQARQNEATTLAASLLTYEMSEFRLALVHTH
ncbi:MAG: hypothetical protein NZ772_16420 [Cyanobacteria bacterium]|nr:hypothetical protein [Cyanobacteriota bacterium]MDW8202908.1 hypothetical protein [Cyanobacteriota bacterium SKYGB_h_bin112]